MRSNTSDFNLTYMYSTEDNASEWKTVYLGTEQVRKLRFVNNVNVLGEY